MHVHLLGIGGTFMGGLALLARELGYRVSGCDAALYPPMSVQLAEQAIEVREGYDPAHLALDADCIVVGNVMTRGRPIVERLLDHSSRYTSGPQWLAEHVLASRWVVAVAGTHGKTTTTAMVAWILQKAGFDPGFLIGGVPGNFPVSARLGAGQVFVVEADEYDSAFFDKRSKFVHYRPRTAILNNLEYDHADIFADLEAIVRQFHHLVRTVPSTGRLIVNAADPELARVLALGCWTPVEGFGADGVWRATEVAADASAFAVVHRGAVVGRVQWSLLGRHNVANALAALAAAAHVGVAPDLGVAALGEFAGVKRRLERKGVVRGVAVYDDFAHHPTAVATTLAGLRPAVAGRLIAVVEPRSNTMRQGTLRGPLAEALALADWVALYQPPNLDWQLADLVVAPGVEGRVFNTTADLVAAVAESVSPGDAVVVMSNGGFDGVQQKLLAALDPPPPGD